MCERLSACQCLFGCSSMMRIYEQVLLDQKAVRVLIVGRSSLHLRSSLMIKLQLWFQGRKHASKEEEECVRERKGSSISNDFPSSEFFSVFLSRIDLSTSVERGEKGKKKITAASGRTAAK